MWATEADQFQALLSLLLVPVLLCSASFWVLLLLFVALLQSLKWRWKSVCLSHAGLAANEADFGFCWSNWSQTAEPWGEAGSVINCLNHFINRQHQFGLKKPYIFKKETFQEMEGKKKPFLWSQNLNIM